MLFNIEENIIDSKIKDLILEHLLEPKNSDSNKTLRTQEGPILFLNNWDSMVISYKGNIHNMSKIEFYNTVKAGKSIDL